MIFVPLVRAANVPTPRRVHSRLAGHLRVAGRDTPSILATGALHTVFLHKTQWQPFLCNTSVSVFVQPTPLDFESVFD